MLLNNCMQSTLSLFGPAITVAKTGNIYQAGLSYGSNSILKEKLGKDPAMYIKDLLTQNFNQSETANNLKVEYKPRSPKYSLVSKNIKDEHAEFMKAVKKILK